MRLLMLREKGASIDFRRSSLWLAGILSEAFPGLRRCAANPGYELPSPTKLSFVNYTELTGKELGAPPCWFL